MGESLKSQFAIIFQVTKTGTELDPNRIKSYFSRDFHMHFKFMSGLTFSVTSANVNNTRITNWNVLITLHSQ